MNEAERKELHSQFHDSGWKGGNGILYPVECLPVAELWASVAKAEKLHRKPFFETVKADIDADGLMFPILCVKTTRQQLIDTKKRYNKSIRDLPFDPAKDDLSVVQYTVWGGSNRVCAAEELGYTHIDCAIIPNLQTAHRLQKDMRAPFKQRYYGPSGANESNRVTSV